MEGKREEIRKGPWKAEEDEVVINHVKKYGPRDWSSIRSKGLLQRTGKSCRLRWVNKLRPNLKSGCKFTSEEERVVIELQAQFGNKWAKIATYLHGRTDNDVKNFWSSRQKRLARILQNSSATSSNTKSHEIINREVAGFTNVVPSSEGQKKSSPSSLSNIDNYDEMVKMVPLTDLVDPNLLHFETNQSHLGDFNQPQLDMTAFSSAGSQQLLASFEDPYWFDVFGAIDGDAAVEQPFLKPTTSCGDGSVNPDAFFDDFPTDMFDQI
ncbi:hypothetical protein LWI28_025928 [Acer negundo]|uniref:Uncharacterized protein n=1 Tax=Acer negundo TaxID=4023 RepID=A0AAD5NW95_ACENE|nr:hypothetical protein LWI28_025928 [Acer negundo]